jgi:hypothetical protein
MSSSEVAPKTSELLDSAKPYEKYRWYPSNDAASFPWEFSVGELYGCICHRPLDELARARLGSIPDSGVQITD